MRRGVKIAVAIIGVLAALLATARLIVGFSEAAKAE